jgi:hypothetical protein
MNIVGSFLKSDNGNKYILVASDYFNYILIKDVTINLR